MSTSLEAFKALQPFAMADYDIDGQHQRLLFDQWRQSKGFNCRSVPTGKIDFWNDCLQRHTPSDTSALVWFESGELREISYQTLLKEAQHCAGIYEGNGLERGSSLAIVAISPVKRTIALLAAFRLGLTVSLLDPQGSSNLKDQLNLFDCDHIYCESAFVAWIPENLESRQINMVRVNEIPDGMGVSYPAGATALRLLDPFDQKGTNILEIPAGYLYMRLLHDATLALELDSGKTYATASQHELGNMPFAELSSLLVGATFLFLDSNAWKNSLETILNLELDAIVIPAKVRNVLVERSGGRKPLWKRWIRNVVDCLDYQSWRAFSQAMDLDEVPHADLQYAPQMAGIAFGNFWSTDLLAMGVLPPSGAHWQFGDLLDPSLPAVVNHGRLCGFIPKEAEFVAVPTPFMLTPFDAAFRFVGCYPPGRRGAAYPAQQVLALLKGQGAGHAIVEKPGAEGVESRTFFILITFRDPRNPETITRFIQDHWGDAAVPDEIIESPLYPRLLANGQVDSGWVTRMYFNGELSRRADSPFYQAMSTFKASLHDHLRVRPSSGP